MSGQQQYVRLCIPMRSGQCNKTATFGHNGRGSVGGVRGCVDRGRGITQNLKNHSQYNKFELNNDN